LKRLLPDYKAIERSIDLVVRNKFGLPSEISPEVHHFDLVMLATERLELDIDDGEVWPMLAGIPPADIAICPMSPGHARVIFLARFNELTVTTQS
ncbi:TPA: HD family hydrolase, partial [Yersinia enterocolitica]|nr:HD family hydrolase [Yersinia enterocolitica]